MDHVVNESLDVNATRQVLKAARLELESVAETIKMLSQHPTLTPGLLTLQMGAAAHLLRGVLQTVEFMSMHPTQLGVAQPNRESA